MIFWAQKTLCEYVTMSRRTCIYASIFKQTVTLCRWPAKQTIPLSVLARNQTKGFVLEISAGPEVVTGREKRVSWKRSSRRQLATGHEQGQLTPDTGAERRVNMRWGPATVKKLKSRWVGIPVALWNFR